MAFERLWPAVLPRLFTADGTKFGFVTVSDTAGFYVKQSVGLSADTLPTIALQVKRVLSPTQLIVGPIDQKISINDCYDVSAYTVALNASINAGMQNKNQIPDKDHYNAIYESDPIVADRVIGVDEYGNFYGPNNPLPVKFDGTIEASEVEIIGTNGNIVEPNADGSINVNVVETPVAGQSERIIYNEITSVASGIQTQITLYTVPITKTAVLHRIEVSGDNVARYDVFYNGNPIATKRTWYGNFNSVFEFITGTNTGFSMNSSDTIAVKVIHSSPFLGTFEGRVQVLEIS